MASAADRRNTSALRAAGGDEVRFGAEDAEGKK